MTVPPDDRSSLRPAEERDPLFRPLAAGRLRLPNRVVMAPMTRSFSAGGVPGANVAAYYRRRIEGGAGLVVTEGSFVDHPTAGFAPNIPRFYGEDAGAAWAGVVEAVHAAGGYIMPQLWHVGPQPLRDEQPHPDRPRSTPSGFIHPDFPDRRESAPMSERDIADVIAGFGNSAALAFALGFDGIQLHAAFGCLIDAFLWEGLNRRTDGYGGSIAARTRFAVEIVRECRRRTAPDFPIYLRFSQWKRQDFGARLANGPNDLEAYLLPLADAGVDMFDAATRRFWEPEFPGSDLNLAGWARKITGKIVSSGGAVGLDRDFFDRNREAVLADGSNLDRLRHMLERGDFDLVSVGRALLVDPDWTNKVRANRLDELVPYDTSALESLL